MAGGLRVYGVYKVGSYNLTLWGRGRQGDGEGPSTRFPGLRSGWEDARSILEVPSDFPNPIQVRRVALRMGQGREARLDRSPIDCSAAAAGDAQDVGLVSRAIRKCLEDEQVLRRANAQRDAWHVLDFDGPRSSPLRVLQGHTADETERPTALGEELLNRERLPKEVDHPASRWK